MSRHFLRPALAVVLLLCGSTPSVVAEGKPCPDQAAALLTKVDPLIIDFQEERRTAISTPRMSLASEIAKLRAIRRSTLELSEWPEESCGIRLREKLAAAEDFDVKRLERFMSGANDPSAKESKELWSDSQFQLKALRELVAATK